MVKRDIGSFNLSGRRKAIETPDGTLRFRISRVAYIILRVLQEREGCSVNMYELCEEIWGSYGLIRRFMLKRSIAYLNKCLAADPLFTISIVLLHDESICLKCTNRE